MVCVGGGGGRAVAGSNGESCGPGRVCTILIGELVEVDGRIWRHVRTGPRVRGERGSIDVAGHVGDLDHGLIGARHEIDGHLLPTAGGTGCPGHGALLSNAERVARTRRGRYDVATGATVEAQHIAVFLTVLQDRGSCQSRDAQDAEEVNYGGKLDHIVEFQDDVVGRGAASQLMGTT